MLLVLGFQWLCSDSKDFEDRSVECVTEDVIEWVTEDVIEWVTVLLPGPFQCRS